MSAEDHHPSLAGEYVLGLLDAADARHCEALLASDAAFAAEVERWRARVTEMDLTALPELPSPRLWTVIEDRIGAPLPAAPLRSAPSAPPRAWLAALWQSLPVWRGVGLGAATAAALLAVGLGFQMREAARTPVLVAVLISDQNRPAAVVNTFANGRSELVPLEQITAPQGKSLQVWTLWDRTRGPVSVGLLDAMRSLTLKLEGLPAAAPDQLFEVTLEPAGGSPTGRPTGPILMKGTASRTL